MTCSPFSSPLIFSLFAPCRLPTVALAVTDYVDAPAGDEVELDSKRLQLEQKRVFFNLKQNSRGKFLKVWWVYGHWPTPFSVLDDAVAMGAVWLTPCCPVALWVEDELF